MIIAYIFIKTMIYGKKVAIVVSENAASFTFHVRVRYRIFQHKEKKRAVLNPFFSDLSFCVFVIFRFPDL